MLSRFCESMMAHASGQLLDPQEDPVFHRQIFERPVRPEGWSTRNRVIHRSFPAINDDQGLFAFLCPIALPPSAPCTE